MKTILISTAYSKKSQALLLSNIENYIKSNRLIIFTQRFTYFFNLFHHIPKGYSSILIPEINLK